MGSFACDTGQSLLGKNERSPSQLLRHDLDIILLNHFFRMVLKSLALYVDLVLSGDFVLDKHIVQLKTGDNIIWSQACP